MQLLFNKLGGGELVALFDRHPFARQRLLVPGLAACAHGWRRLRRLCLCLCLCLRQRGGQQQTTQQGQQHATDEPGAPLRHKAGYLARIGGVTGKGCRQQAFFIAGAHALQSAQQQRQQQRRAGTQQQAHAGDVEDVADVHRVPDKGIRAGTHHRPRLRRDTERAPQVNQRQQYGGRARSQQRQRQQEGNPWLRRGRQQAEGVDAKSGHHRHQIGAQRVVARQWLARRQQDGGHRRQVDSRAADGQQAQARRGDHAVAHVGGIAPGARKQVGPGVQCGKPQHHTEQPVVVPDQEGCQALCAAHCCVHANPRQIAVDGALPGAAAFATTSGRLWA